MRRNSDSVSLNEGMNVEPSRGFRIAVEFETSNQCPTIDREWIGWAVD